MLTQPMGNVIIQDHVDGVQGYDEDQILGTPMISHIMKIDALVIPWVNAQVAYLFLVV